VNRLLWTPTPGQDVTKSLFPLSGEPLWPWVLCAILLIAEFVAIGFMVAKAVSA